MPSSPTPEAFLFPRLQMYLKIDKAEYGNSSLFNTRIEKHIFMQIA